ncbi:MAG: hypothetical protein V1845_02545 [bacterium]
MKIAVLKSVGSNGMYPVPLVLIQNFLLPFFTKAGWTVADFAVVERSASFILLKQEVQASNAQEVLADFLKYADEVAHAPATRDELEGVRYPSLYLSNISLLAVLDSSDQDGSIFAGYLLNGLLCNTHKPVVELEEKIRDIARKFKNM